jgi:iron complex transport system permease protein
VPPLVARWRVWCSRWLLARGVQHTLRLLLAGVIVGVVLGALKDLVMLMQPDMMLAMQAFMLGSTGFGRLVACL